MRNYVIIFLLSISIARADVVNLSINAQKHEKASLLLAFIGAPNPQNEIMRPLVKKALEFTHQLQVDAIAVPAIMSKQEALQKKEQGYSYIAFVIVHPDMLEWHLFSVDDARMIRNKRIAKSGTHVRGWAYSLADSLYQTLTGAPGFFSTKIAYIKNVPHGKTHYGHIYIADYDGSNAQPIVQTATVNVAPRWNKDKNRPLLFYSEYTNTNMRMMAVDMHQKRIVASNFDGLNMLPAFGDDGKSVIYCATKGSNSCHLYYWTNKILKKLTANDGNNFAPVFAHGGTSIYFTSDFETGRPQIYAMDLSAGQLERITGDGYCVSPSYCARNKKIAYSKMVQGIMQLFVYDEASKDHIQLTYDSAQKEECSWSPCGTFLLCPVSTGKNKTRIALFNQVTKEYHYLTDTNESCHAPAWSISYNEFPVIT